MSWTYVQASGQLLDPNGETEGRGYSGGDHGLRLDAVNNTLLENLADVGPIPCGSYTRADPIPWDSRLGEYVIPLIPDMVTRAKILDYGRDPDTFYMHGDSRAHAGMQMGSDGCICMALVPRQEFGTSLDKELQVVPTIPQTLST